MHSWCAACGHRFFAADDDIVNGSYYCSYCLPDIISCRFCNQTFKTPRRSKSVDQGTCPSCYARFVSAFPNWFLSLRWLTFRRDNFRCQYCGRAPLLDPSVRLQADHIVPRAAGGKDRLDNLVTACAECNNGKKDILLDDAQCALFANRPRIDVLDEGKGDQQMEDRKTNWCHMANCSHVAARCLSSNR